MNLLPWVKMGIFKKIFSTNMCHLNDWLACALIGSLQSKTIWGYKMGKISHQRFTEIINM